MRVICKSETNSYYARNRQVFVNFLLAIILIFLNSHNECWWKFFEEIKAISHKKGIIWWRLILGGERSGGDDELMKLLLWQQSHDYVNYYASVHDHESNPPFGKNMLFNHHPFSLFVTITSSKIHHPWHAWCVHQLRFPPYHGRVSLNFFDQLMLVFCIQTNTWLMEHSTWLNSIPDLYYEIRLTKSWWMIKQNRKQQKLMKQVYFIEEQWGTTNWLFIPR